MSLKQKLKNRPALYNMLLHILNTFDYFNFRFRIQFPKYKITETWKNRIDLVCKSPDNAKIRHVQNSGKIMHDHQVMHNGIKICLASYYDYGNTILIRENKGVHEPQEEYAFQQVLPLLPAGSVMLELGSYWAFYSMWFANTVHNARCIMVEPDPHKMNFGKLNFKLNNLKGTFDLGFINDVTNLSLTIPVYSVDYLMEKHNLSFIHILHSDIQGYEFNMLNGASKALQNKQIGFIFISTHSNELHRQCHDLIKESGYDILCSANLDESYSWDGLLVAQKKNFSPLTTIDIHLNKQMQ